MVLEPQLLRQMVAVFSNSTDIYFARAQVAERMRSTEDELPP